MKIIEEIYLLYWGAGILIIGGLVYTLISQYMRKRERDRRQKKNKGLDV